ncbi:MAG: gpW family head-tail joining protein [Gammaproteobacteria bacterium]
MMDCVTRLSEAKTALHNLQMGESIVSVSYNGRLTTYTPADMDKLSAYISRLGVECDESSTGAGRRGAIMFRD